MRYLVLLSFILSPMTPADARDVWISFQNGGQIAVPSDGPLTPGDVQWQVELTGYGQSSPVVWDEHVYVTTVEGDNKDKCHVTAIRLSDGSRLWQHTVPNASPAESSNYISRAAPTPAVDENGIIASFEGGNVVALTHAGSVRWQRNLVADYGAVNARHGLSASLEQDMESVFVWVERSEQPYIVRLNKQTGMTLWKSPGLGATSWASPRLIPVDGGRHLVLSAIGRLVGLDPSTGKQLWTFDGITGNSTPTPMPMGNGRFLIGATAGRGESGGGRAAESNGVVRISRADDGTWTADFLWKARRATSSFGSPIAHSGVAFFVNREGVLYGLNSETGEEQFAKRLKGSLWATPIAIGEQLLFCQKDGKIDVLSNLQSSRNLTTWDQLSATTSSEPDGGPDAVASSAASEEAVLYAAVCAGDGLLLLRRGDSLAAVDLRAP